LTGFPADGGYMAALAARLPRLAVIGGVLLFASATLTWGAAQRLTAVPTTKRTVFVKPTVVVPDVTGQAFVFAKGTLEDAGFAWHVGGKVQGFSTNVVATQTPAPGTKLIDTGAPLVQVTLTRGKYPQTGQPEDLSPYVGTAVTLANPAPVTPAPATATPVAPAPAAATPVASAAPAATATTQANPKPEPKAAPKKQPAAAKRPPAFVVAGAPKEPLDEMPLTERAQRLNAWLSAHRRPTNANVSHFLYQQSWVVTGAKFGWWHGAEALRVLIAADRRAESLWGVGRKSELAARKALAEVEARSR
jgi:cell division septation protein DedD